jgi:hypothetical protein
MTAKRRRPLTVVDRTDPNFRLDAVVDGMRVEHLQCRDFGHSWRPFTARQVKHIYEQQLRCSRCHTLRKRLLSMRGEVLSSSYEYADSYVIKGLGRIVGDEKDHLRLASILKLVVEDTAEEA